jgi:hypothetical protein
MKTLMIYPEYPATFWSFKCALKFIHRRAALPPKARFSVWYFLMEFLLFSYLPSTIFSFGKGGDDPYSQLKQYMAEEV